MSVSEPGPPDLRKAGRIRDPVHGYVFFTGVERVILDHPIAQRLRHVAQSGMAQMVFPEIRSSRFSHSLGAMHLASQFLASSLANADVETRMRVEEVVRAEVHNPAGFGIGLPDDDLRALFRNQDRTDPESESALCLWDRERGESIPLTTVSPIVKGLDRAWMADLQVHAFGAAADRADAQAWSSAFQWRQRLERRTEMGYTTEDFFREIDGNTYSYREFEDQVIALFNEHLSDFPPHYTYRDAITWADRNGWLHPGEGEFAVNMRGVTAA